MEQGDAVQVEDGLGLGMVAQLGMVAGEAEDVVDAEVGGAEQVGLQRHAVPVAAGHLEDGVQPGVLQGLAGGQGAQTHDGGLVVRHVHGGDAAEIFLRFRDQAFDVESLGRTNFGGNDKFTTGKKLSNFHYKCSSSLNLRRSGSHSVTSASVA